MQPKTSVNTNHPVIKAVFKELMQNLMTPRDFAHGILAPT
jgi:hypothetical protein